MEIKKSTEVREGGVPTPDQLAAIHAISKTALTEEQVYVFSLRLCDDQVDRDFERFDRDALPVLAKLFIGKTGISDHRWSADGQVARIFATEVVHDDRECFIKAWAYIRRGGKGEETIADIEAGIKKEVSVGCSMGQRICSICGAEYGECGHEKGRSYDGQICCAILREPLDAYEFSFVAVPAQREAGVLKAALSHCSLKELAEEYGAQAEYRALFRQAELGKRYTKQLEDEVVRLSLLLELGIDEATLRSAAGKVSAEELTRIKSALEDRVSECFPVRHQLSMGHRQEPMEAGFLI